MRETVEAADRKLELLTPLGFGNANVVVAVPQAWIDVRTMADLEDVAATFYTKRGKRMRVATKYVNLTRRFFAENHVGDYSIVESLGATEGAPAAGQAELIVDITTTGATLAANGLKVLDDGVILRSEANLVASLGACWDEETREQARQILGRIAAEEIGAHDPRRRRAVRRRPSRGPGEPRRGGGRALRRHAALAKRRRALDLDLPARQGRPARRLARRPRCRARDGGSSGLRVRARQPAAREAAATARLTVVRPRHGLRFVKPPAASKKVAAQGASLILDGTTARDAETNFEADAPGAVHDEKPHGRLTKKIFDAVIPDHVEDKHAARRKILRWLGLGLSLAIAALAIFVLTRTFMQIDVGDLRDAIAATSSERIALALGLTTVSFLALTGYDGLALAPAQAEGPLPHDRAGLVHELRRLVHARLPADHGGHGALLDLFDQGALGRQGGEPDRHRRAHLLARHGARHRPRLHHPRRRGVAPRPPFALAQPDESASPSSPRSSATSSMPRRAIARRSRATGSSCPACGSASARSASG